MSRLQEVTTEYRRRLLAQESGAVRDLEMHYASVLQAIQPQLDSLYDDISAKEQDGERVPPSWIYQERRMEALKQLVKGHVDQFGMLALAKTGELQRLAVALGIEGATALLQASVPLGVAWTFGVPSTIAIASLIGATQAGSPLARLFRGFGLEAAQRVSSALVTGLTLGWNPRRIAPLVERALQVPRWRALVISRQESLRCYRSANMMTFRENSDVVGKWRWTCAKQKRTCIACLMMDGTLHELSEEFGSHVQCRCTPVPVTKSWKDILGDDSIADTRPRIKSGKDWFLGQDEATQRAIMSDSKYEAWQDGKFALESTVKHTHDKEWGDSIAERPLKELVK